MSRPPAIRLATVKDAAALAPFKCRCFRETFVEEFAMPYLPADIARFEADAYGEAVVTAELADPTHAHWVVEDEGGALLAYAHAGPCKLPHAEAAARDVELYQLYLLRSAQGSGLSRLLMERTLGWMESRVPERQWLGVWSGNVRAQRFYAHFGFRQAGTYEFAVGDHRDHEFIYRRG